MTDQKHFNPTPRTHRFSVIMPVIGHKDADYAWSFKQTNPSPMVKKNDTPHSTPVKETVHSKICSRKIYMG